MFWILVSALTIVALVIVVFPLVRVTDKKELSREQQNIAIAKQNLAALKKQKENQEISEDQFIVSKQELENSLALDLENQQSTEKNQDGKWLIYVLVIFLPVASFSLYSELGDPSLLDPQARLAARANQPAPDLSNMPIQKMVDIVKQRLEDNPEDGEGWYMLGRTFMSAQKYPEAVKAYRRSHEIVGDNPNILLSLADALAMSSEGEMKGEPEQLVQKAIEIEPNNGIALWLGGLAAEQRGDAAEAYKLWNRLLPLLSNDPASAEEVSGILVQLKADNPELPALPFTLASAPTADISTPSESSGTSVSLLVSISDTVRSKLNGNEQVFVYAKAVSGPPMPLAARKFTVSELPVEVTLSDADAMMPQLTLSTVSAFTVGARVSMSGNPIPQKGDYFMEVSPLTSENSADKIILDISKIVQ